jgi:hypothetical protein
MNRAPKGIYVVAVMFFFMGLVCIAELLAVIFYALGFERSRGLLFQPGYLWVLLSGLLLFWVLCYAVVALVRQRSVGQWIFLAMTFFLAVRFPLCLVLLPPVIPCWIYLYLLRQRFQTADRKAIS